MSLPRRTRWTTAVGLRGLLGASLGLACAALAACSSISGSQQGYAQGSGGGPIGGGSAANGAGEDASTGSPTPAQNPGGGGGDDASGGASDANAPSPDGGAATDAGPTDGGDGATPAVTFTLLNATITNVVQGSPVAGYDPIAAGSTFSLATVGASLSIRANTTAATVGSVEFILDANYTHTEDMAPYTLCGDNGAGTITPCPQLAAGQHTLTATEFTQANLGGTTEGTASVDFTITP
jgi:hypothetical protein